ncbi:MAG TPA: RidA family protein [Acidimicrobiales bacterium]|nr:RidA family protein [Acidimicrobiales bacterium]
MTIECIQPAGLMEVPGLAQVIVARGSQFVFISGQTPLTADGALVGEGNLGEQARHVFTNLKTALSAANATIADVVRTTVYVVDYTPNMLDELYPPAYEVFGDGFTAGTSTLLGVQSLFMPGQLLEIDAIAILD